MDPVTLATILIPVAVIVLFILIRMFRVIPEYERGISFRFGHLRSELKPGLNIVFPLVDSLQRVDMRVITLTIPPQEVITKDNVTVGVDAVVYFRVINAPKAVLETTNYIYATSQFAQAALRDVTGNVDMDDLLAKREEISQQIKEIVDAETDKWGIDVENVKIQNIELPGDMKRAMAKQAEAERERRANIINADGEKAAAETLAQAAEILAKTQGAINLRTLNTLERISTEPSQKTMMLFPIELIDAIRGGKK